ncbi:DNA polymerase III subunit epsilon [Spiribacter vilamensis]|uniref:DNA polymerase III subunit epsilon n=1 Tax=Spiribacter vilamensis TaxID=531306 RepID=A0A4Q8CYP2_9GAMM|nr:DNA polymerase III subunit epsilon [Spiribacter vilamensis]RZU98020.1 DNA polymerase-3 subunit epsilon [Spiribacter vilamensis]TVO61075.1 DNA polymerase III subunit epsilon [Spiribacter vilamensis]
MRQIILDTETTGLEPENGHRIIEIGCYEVEQRRPTGRRFHEYINPDRAVDPEAVEVHGITDRFLMDKPRFADIARSFLDFVADAELIIHNALFDVGFLDSELGRLGTDWGRIADHCRVTDSLTLARRRHPGQRNSLDALCRRYAIDNSGRSLHGALLDAEILAEVYLAMTGGQVTLHLGAREEDGPAQRIESDQPVSADRPRLRVVEPTAAEIAAHASWLDQLDRESDGRCVWRALDGEARG